MKELNVNQLFPQFLLNDKNGYAMAHAIVVGLELFRYKLQEATATVLDVELMPEWRLDELAWEYGCLYDYTADVEAKREWIRRAMEMYSIVGTPGGIHQYLKGYFEEVKVLERGAFDGEPYTFRVETRGDYSRSLEMWSLEATNRAKNIRSVLDRLTMYMLYRDERNINHALKAHVTEIVTAQIGAE